VLTQWLFGQSSDQLLVESLDIGTVAALIIYFWPRLIALARQVFVERDYRLLRNVVITALPAGVVGLLLAGFIEKSSFLVNPLMVAIMLAVVGVVMVVVDRLPHLSPQENGQRLSAGRALVIGLVQTLALIPGVSRSGSTIVAGRFMGLSSAAAAEFSFLVSIPIMLGLIAKLFLKSTDRAYMASHLSVVVVGNIAAFISGLLAISFLLRYLERHGLGVFGWYRIVLALAVVGVLLIR